MTRMEARILRTTKLRSVPAPSFLEVRLENPSLVLSTLLPSAFSSFLPFFIPLSAHVT